MEILPNRVFYLLLYCIAWQHVSSALTPWAEKRSPLNRVDVSKMSPDGH